ncbi:MAG: phosphoethanolamine transferase [Muribaculaceae bacterium]|nr:phosphoethanolamine transferase [Muribaculaceae bacterium]
MVFNLLLVADYFMLLNFHGNFNQDAVDIIMDTNPGESAEFLNTYLNWWKATLWIAGVVAFNVASWKAAKCTYKYISGNKIVTAVACVILGAAGCYIGKCAWNYLRYADGMSITQCNSLVRAAYAWHIAMQNLQIYENIVRNNTDIAARAAEDAPRNVVVVIGESHSVFHSQLYGYKKNTEPLMSELRDKGSLTVMKDAITPWDRTTKALASIFSTSGAIRGLTASPVFPQLFRKAGYRTVMLDNQCVAGGGTSVNGDRGLSEAMFNERNTRLYPYDEDMLQLLDSVRSQDPTLYVIHLMGQHYTYSERYPRDASNSVFSSTDYPDSISEEIRSRRAHYDNATLHTDRNLRSIINHFRDKDCAVIYFSDHGEELGEDGFGHGYAASSSMIDRQIRVPMWIWLSDSFREKRPEMASRVARASTLRITTDDVSQAILSLGGIETPFYDPKRSFLSGDYDSTRTRIAIQSIDFDRASKAAFE